MATERIVLFNDMTFAEGLTQEFAERALSAAKASPAAEFIDFYLTWNRNLPTPEYQLRGKDKALCKKFGNSPNKFYIHVDK